MRTARPTLHLDFHAGRAKTILAPMGHHVPETLGLGPQLKLLALKLLDVAWIIALGFGLGLRLATHGARARSFLGRCR